MMTETGANNEEVGRSGLYIAYFTDLGKYDRIYSAMSNSSGPISLLDDLQDSIEVKRLERPFERPTTNSNNVCYIPKTIELAPKKMTVNGENYETILSLPPAWEVGAGPQLVNGAVRGDVVIDDVANSVDDVIVMGSPTRIPPQYLTAHKQGSHLHVRPNQDYRTNGLMMEIQGQAFKTYINALVSRLEKEMYKR